MLLCVRESSYDLGMPDGTVVSLFMRSHNFQMVRKLHNSYRINKNE
jgi:hypothetical protein